MLLPPTTHIVAVLLLPHLALVIIAACCLGRHSRRLGGFGPRLDPRLQGRQLSALKGQAQ